MSDSHPTIRLDEATEPFYVGVDLGGSSVKVGLVDDRGRTLSWHKIPAEVHRGPEEGARRMGEAVGKVAGDAGLKPDDIAGVGLGSPGTMDIPSGMLLEPHNLPGWQDFPIRDALKRHCGRAVTFVNDANAATYGEYWVGRGRAFHSMVLLTLGTGIGCGIIIGDLLIEGEHSHGAECGHIIIDFGDEARVCPCGQPGHLEGYASARSVIARTEEALAAGRASVLSARIAAGEQLAPLMLAQAAEAGDELSLEIILETARYLGVGIVSLIHTIDPDGVVLGGAMTFGGGDMELGRRFLERIRQEVRERAFPVLTEKVQVDFASLGGDAGYIGAAGIARMAHRKSASRA